MPVFLPGCYILINITKITNVVGGNKWPNYIFLVLSSIGVFQLLCFGCTYCCGHGPVPLWLWV